MQNRLTEFSFKEGSPYNTSNLFSYFRVLQMGQHLPWTIFDEDFADLSFRDFIGRQPVAFPPPRVVQLQESMEKTLQRATRRQRHVPPWSPHLWDWTVRPWCRKPGYLEEALLKWKRFLSWWFRVQWLFGYPTEDFSGCESHDLKWTGMHQICIHFLLEYNHPTWRANTPVEQNRSHKTANQPHIFRTSIHWGLCGRCLRGVSLGLLTKQLTPVDDDALVRQLKVPPVLFCSSRCWGGTVPFLCGMTEYYQTCFCFVIFGGQEGQEHVWHQQDPGHLGQPLLWSHHPQVREPGYDIDKYLWARPLSWPKSTHKALWSEVPDWYEQEILSGKRKTSWRWS